MEIGPIFRALFRSKTRFFLIVTEIALTLAIVVNCMNMIADQRNYLTRSTGMDEAHLISVVSEPFAPEFEDRAYARNAFREDMDALKAMPGVLSASSLHAIPLSGGGSSTGRRRLGSEEEPISTPLYLVARDSVETLGIQLASGRNFIETDFHGAEEDQQNRIDAEARGEELEEDPDEISSSNVLVTRAIAERLFPDEDPLGKIISNRDETARNTIVGVIEEMHNSWPMSSVHDRVMLVPSVPYGLRRARFMVRAEPGMVDGLYKDIEERLLEVNSGRILTVRTLSEIKQDSLETVNAMIKILGGISGLLVAVTSLGIIGLTAFSVTQRTRQIGTRRALGATRLAVLRYFLVENWVITSFGLAFGLILTYGLNFALAQVAGLPMIGLPLVGSGMAALWAVGIIATLASAFRSMSISPVLATRNV